MKKKQNNQTSEIIKKKENPALELTKKKIIFSFILIIIAFALSLFPVVVLEDGGSWTFFSLLPLWLITYFFGMKYGVIFSFIFSIFKLIATILSEGTLVLSEHFIKESGILKDVIPSRVFLLLILEYVLACSMFFMGGILKTNRESQIYILDRQQKYITNTNNQNEYQNKINKTITDTPPLPIYIKSDLGNENSLKGLIGGYAIGVGLMLSCYVLSAVFCYTDESYHGVEWALKNNWTRILYSFIYDFGYLLTEALTTILILIIPAVHNSIFKLKHMVNSPNYDEAISGF